MEIKVTGLDKARADLERRKPRVKEAINAVIMRAAKQIEAKNARLLAEMSAVYHSAGMTY